MAPGRHHAVAGAGRDQLEGVGLVVPGRGARSGRARGGIAIVLPLPRDAEALFEL